MRKTTLYLPERLRQALKRAAEATGSSEAALIRSAIERATSEIAAPRPRLPLFQSQARADLAERVDEALRGAGGKAFGER
jgi:hypothetical protein